MYKLKNLYILSLLFGLINLTASCTDEYLTEEDSEVEMAVPAGQFALGFTVTLDAMGGNGDFNPMEEWENYIDPQKFRVLFFDDQERFLFESKSRWVKKQTSDNTNTSWYVSVPFYSYGNDNDYNWEFDDIRDALMRNDFKIALLVNRPLYEYSSDYSNKDNGDDGGKRSGWFDNGGPHWTRNNSRFGAPVNDSIKYIFDLHHSQFDPVYSNKSRPTGYTGEGFYDFVADEPKDPDNDTNAMMGSFKSWVDWDGEKVDNANYVTINETDYKRIVLPSKEHPIPMYGVQDFKKIDPKDWKDGTTFNLGRKGDVVDLPISLLRSCVKVELVVPKDVEWAVLMYSNICSRCEPLNVWTPTNELWCKGTDYNNCNEMDAILAYGPMSRATDTNSGLDGYRKRLSWFYGAWKDKELKEGEKKWTFGTFGTANFAPAGAYGYPQIYNPIIQRNETAVVYSSKVSHKNLKIWKNGDNYHLIAYTGERNLNDPSSLTTIAGSGSAYNTPMVFWQIMFKNDTKVYFIPITDYSNTKNTARNIGTVTDDGRNLKDLGRYGAVTGTNKISILNYESNIRNQDTDSYPYPLIRNHVYRLYMSGTRGDDEMMISSQHSYSKSICFPEAVK